MEGLKQSINLKLTDDYPRAVYHQRKWENKKNIIHWGQRKLLMSELYFMTHWGHLGKQIVYAGAAPGNHIPYLSYLFPNHSFTLIDPNPFRIKETEKIKIMNCYFDDNMAKKYQNDHVLFISDMRTADYRQMSCIENEQYIIKDNETQMRWINLMKPVKSMIKFRCPYPDIIKENTRMFKGIILLQPWAPPTSTETRLIVDSDLTIIEYDNLKYEQQLFYHNSIARFANYSQPVKGEGLDDRFDASAEVVILCEFFEKNPHYANNQPLFKTIANMSHEISLSITNTSRTLATPMKDPEERRNFPKIDHRGFYKSGGGQSLPGGTESPQNSV